MEKDDLVPRQSAIEARQTPQLLLMSAPPDDAIERQVIGNELWVGLVLRFEQTLSEEDLALWRNPPSNVSTFPEHLRVVNLFDEFLLRQFAEWGWRMFMSLDIVRRMAQWEIHSPDLCRRLGEMMELKSMVFRGEKPSPFLEGIEKFADDVIDELQRLLRMQRDVFAQRPTVRCERIAEWMKLTIEEQPSLFPRLHLELGQLHGYVASLPKLNPAAARSLERGDIRAEGFFYQWYAACTNRSTKDVRNRISALRNKR